MFGLTGLMRGRCAWRTRGYAESPRHPEIAGEKFASRIVAHLLFPVASAPLGSLSNKSEYFRAHLGASAISFEAKTVTQKRNISKFCYCTEALLYLCNRDSVV